MSLSTDKHKYSDVYVVVYIVAESLGGTGLNVQEEDGLITISGTMPTKYALNQMWDQVKDIDPALSAGGLTMNLSASRDDIYGEYEVQPGDNLSKIAKEITKGALSYQAIFEANTDQLDDANVIKVGQVLVIPNF